MNVLKHFFGPKRPPTADDNARALLKAAAKGKLEEVRVLLEQGTEVNAEDKHHCTALIKAASGGHWAVVQWLLENGANVNARGEYGETSLMLAAWCNNGLALTNGQLARSRWESGGVTADAVVRHLIGKGADVDMKLGRNMSFLAINGGCAGDTVRGFATETGSTALIMAAAQGHFEIVKLLLEAGADATTRIGNFTALSLVELICSKTSEAASYNAFEAARSVAYRKVISYLPF